MEPHRTQETDPDMDELTLSEVSDEFRINRGTVGNWVNRGELPSSSEHYSELGVKYYKVRRGDVTKVIQKHAGRGRPLKRS